MKIKEVLDRIYHSKIPTASDLISILNLKNEKELQEVYIYADSVREKFCGSSVLLRGIIEISNECDNISNLTDSEREWFYRYVSEIDNNDIDTFAGLSDEKRKETYREALKEVEPGNHKITCPVCESSPWKYEKGDCQLCGNKSTK